MDNAVGHVVRRPEIRRLLVSVTASATARWVYNVGLAAFVYGETQSATWLAAVAVGRYLPSLLMSPLAAVAAGRFPQRTTMVTCDVLASLAVAVITAVAAGRASVLVVVLLAAGASTVTRARVPVTAAYLSELVEETELAAANAALRATESAALVLGPVIGAVLVLVGGPALALGVTAGEFALSALVTATLPSNATRFDGDGDGGVLRELAAGVGAIASEPASRYFALLGAGASLLFGIDTVLLVVLAQERLRSGSSGYGLLLAGLGVGGLLGALAVDRLCRTSRLGLVAAGALVCYAAPTVLFLFVRSQPVAVSLEVVRGAGSLLAEAVALTALQRSAHGRSMSQVLAVFYGGLLAALVVGAGITPPVLDGVGLDGALLLAGAAIPGVLLLSLPRLVALDREGETWAAELNLRVAVLDELQIFDGARRPTLERLASGFTEVRVPAGTAIVTEGEPADAFYVVLEGAVEVFADVGSDRRRLLRRLEAPSYLGEIGLIHQLPRTATCVAATAVRLYRADGPDFLAALADAPIAPTLADGVLTRLRQHRSEPAPSADQAALRPG